MKCARSRDAFSHQQLQLCPAGMGTDDREGALQGCKGRLGMMVTGVKIINMANSKLSFWAMVYGSVAGAVPFCMGFGLMGIFIDELGFFETIITGTVIGALFFPAFVLLTYIIPEDPHV